MDLDFFKQLMEQIQKSEQNKKNKNKELAKLAKAQRRVQRKVRGTFFFFNIKSVHLFMIYSFFWTSSHAELHYFLMQHLKERKWTLHRIRTVMWWLEKRRMRTSQMMEEVIPVQRNAEEEGRILQTGESRGPMERVCIGTIEKNNNNFHCLVKSPDELEITAYA